MRRHQARDRAADNGMCAQDQGGGSFNHPHFLMAGKSEPSRVIEEFGQGRVNLHQFPLHLGGNARNLGYRQIGFVLQKLLLRPPPTSVLGVFLDLLSVWSGVAGVPHKR